MEVVGISKAQWTRFTPTVPYLKIYAEKKKVFFVKQNNLFFEDFRLSGYLQVSDPGTHSLNY